MESTGRFVVGLTGEESNRQFETLQEWEAHLA